jgi:hypothetical protein
MSDINNHLNAIVKQLKRLNMRLSMPYGLGIKFISKTKGGVMANIMVYGLTAGSAGSTDVIERRLTVTVNGEVVENRTYAGDIVDLGELKVAQDADVSLALVDVDDVGNVSSPAIYVFKATDSVAPPVPGSFGVNIIREE